MTDTIKLKGKIVGNGFTITSLAKELHMSKPTLSQKINNKIKFSQENIREISKKLNLSGDEIREIFLN